MNSSKCDLKVKFIGGQCYCQANRLAHVTLIELTWSSLFHCQSSLLTFDMILHRQIFKALPDITVEVKGISAAR